MTEPDRNLGTPDFTIHDWPASRVLFGRGVRRRLADELERLGISRALLISDAALGHDAAEWVGKRLGTRTDDVRQHVSPETIQRALTLAGGCKGVDGVVCVGGGSATGLAKGIALHTSWPLVAVPTTYAGSEMTSIWGLTEGGVKRTGRDERVRPRTVLYDPDLTTTLPQDVSVTSAVNALAHCVEALYAPAVSPLTVAAAAAGARTLLVALPQLAAHGITRSVLKHPTSGIVDVRADLLRGAWFAGWALNVAAMGVHHKVCHVLGGRFDLPHAALHTALLPYSIALAPPAAVAPLADALEVPGPEVAGGVWRLIRDLGASTSLKEVGLRAADLPEARTVVAAKIASDPHLTPRPLTGVEATRLVNDAWEGKEPTHR